MENLKQILYEKQLELEEIEKTNKKTLERLPEGYVNISKNKNSIQYYWRKDDGTETYINKKNRSIIKKLAQKEYEKKVQIIIKKNKKCLRNMLDKYEFDETLKAYDKISDKKKIFVEPYTMPNEMYAEKWQAEQNKLKEQIPKYKNPILHLYYLFEIESTLMPTILGRLPLKILHIKTAVSKRFNIFKSTFLSTPQERV